MMELKNLIRKNILALKPYSCARTEFTGEASVFVDANENPFETGFNRYPDPYQIKLKEEISRIKGVGKSRIFLGNGSDEAIDLLYRIFCEPRIDNVVAPAPTYGMYEVCADINDVEYRHVRLNEDFSLNVEAIMAATDQHTKIIFLCSPNNPTGNLLDEEDVVAIIERFGGIVVVDEAYIDFAHRKSMIEKLGKYPNLVILQTFSKAWGQASVRLGMAFASDDIICYFNSVKYPYNINILAQQHMLEIIEKDEAKVAEEIKIVLMERDLLEKRLGELPEVKHVYPSDANFLLIRVDDADKVYTYLVNNGVVVRNRNRVTLCEGCLRITVGTPEENERIVELIGEL